MITGGGSGIGAATARAMAAEGAEIAILDRDHDGGESRRQDNRQARRWRIACDVTDPAECAPRSTRWWKHSAASTSSSPMRAPPGRALSARWTTRPCANSFELNFFAHQTVAQNAVRIMKAQGTYGCLLFNTSKQAVNPGKDFGPYGLPKAATLFLVRQYALDHGKDGIRANAVNADRMRTGLLTDEMVAARSKARGVSESAYMSGNLLGREVYANEVAEAFVYLAHAEKTTAGVITVDGGNIEAAMR